MRIGIVGYGGRINGVLNECVRPVRKDIKLVGIVDPDEARARARVIEADRKDVVFYRNLDEMMKKARIDALMIGTRCNLHAPYAIQAAKYDVPLYLEKPVAIDMKQALALEKAFSKTRCRVVVSFPLRVSPICEQVKMHIGKGEVGEPVHISAVNYVPYGTVYWEEKYRDFSITGGLLLQKATHDFDYISYLMGSRIKRVATAATFQKVFGGRNRRGLVCSECGEQAACLESPLNRRKNQTSGIKGDHKCLYSIDCGTAKTGTNEDCSSTVMEFESGAAGAYSQVFFTRRDAATRGAIISGYMGTISFDWYSNDLRLVRHHAPFSMVEKAGEGASHFGGDAVLARDFVGLVEGAVKKSRTPIECGIQSVYTCLAAMESTRRGRFVDVRQVNL